MQLSNTTRDTLIFIGVLFAATGALGFLKVAAIFQLSWFWVLTPIWAPLGLGIALLTLVMAVIYLAALGRDRRKGL